MPKSGARKDVNTSANWYLSSKYGLYVTWAYEGPYKGPDTHTACGCYPDGRLPGSVDEIADAFDVRQFADDCKEMGVQYVNFTAYHAHMYVLYPSKVLESRLPGHTSKRDVIRELLDALHARGIKLQLYIHATIGDTMTEEERAALNWYDATDGYKQWNDFFNEFFDEMAARYGTDMDSYYIDMIFDYPYLDMIDRHRLRKTLLAYNPDVTIVGNGDVIETVDNGSREDARVFIPDSDDRLAFPVQSVVCLSDRWWSSVPASKSNAAKYAPEHLFRYLVLTAGANVGGGGLALGASPYVPGGFEPGVKETMVALGHLIEPVSESIKNTFPSASYVTPAGVSINSLKNGFVATRSVDDKYEYIHVLVPPRDNILVLPPPLDGKQFSEASMPRSGKRAEIDQDETGVRVTVPDKWDRLDTVIKLSVDSIPSYSQASISVPRSQISAVCDDEMPGHEAHRAIDGRDETFWCTSSARSHMIILDLHDEYRVNKVRVLPRQDGFTGAHLVTHITTYSVHVSLDGENYRPAATGEWKRTSEEKHASFPPIAARYIKIASGPDWQTDKNRKFPRGAASAAEINVEAVKS